MLFLNCCKIFD